MFTPSRAEVRAFFIKAWQKQQHQQELSELEKMACRIIAEHAEYHAALHPDFVDTDYLPEYGATNPFLHLSLHLTIAEQLAIDRPHGIRAIFFSLCQKTPSEHEAIHLMMENLAEMLWQAERNQSPPDVSIYLDGLRKLGIRDPTQP